MSWKRPDTFCHFLSWLACCRKSALSRRDPTEGSVLRRRRRHGISGGGSGTNGSGSGGGGSDCSGIGKEEDDNDDDDDDDDDDDGDNENDQDDDDNDDDDDDHGDRSLTSSLLSISYFPILFSRPPAKKKNSNRKRTNKKFQRKKQRKSNNVQAPGTRTPLGSLLSRSFYDLLAPWAHVAAVVILALAAPLAAPLEVRREASGQLVAGGGVVPLLVGGEGKG